LAFYDSLTELPNRRLLDDRLSQAVLGSKRSESYCALIFIDLDNFKPLNDTHGHVVGDLLLVQAAERLKKCIREVDTVARFGGDEFVILLRDLHLEKADALSMAERIAHKVLSTLSEPYNLSVKPDCSVEHHCTASIGVTMFLGRDADTIDVLKLADAAMYQAKDAGRNAIRFHNPALS
jgi:diguanylate cyclase (GGDEF)-like protein